MVSLRWAYVIVYFGLYFLPSNSEHKHHHLLYRSYRYPSTTDYSWEGGTTQNIQWWYIIFHKPLQHLHLLNVSYPASRNGCSRSSPRTSQDQAIFANSWPENPKGVIMSILKKMDFWFPPPPPPQKKKYVSSFSVFAGQNILTFIFNIGT